MATPRNLTGSPHFDQFSSQESVPVRFSPVTLRIESNDISEMDYFCNEAPMVYPAAKNAVAFALQRIIVPELGTALVTEKKGSAWARIGKNEYWLGTKLGAWLDHAMRGWRMSEVSEIIWLPEDIIPQQRLRKTLANW